MAKNKPEKAARIRSMIKAWDDSFRQNNEHYFKMQNFVMGDQWHANERNSLTRKKKVPLVMNVLSPMANHTLAEQRMNTPNITIEPDGDIPEQTATVRSALVKNITFDSNATVIFQNAFSCSLIGGYGAWEIGTKYKNEKTFEQVIEIREHSEPTKCYWDTGALLPEKIDGQFAGYRVDMTRRKFTSLFGKAIADKIGYTDYDTKNRRVKNPDQSINNSQNKKIKENEGGAAGVLTNEKYITVIYHFEVKSVLTKLYEMSDGSVFTASELADLEKQQPIMDDGETVFADTTLDMFGGSAERNAEQMPDYSPTDDTEVDNDDDDEKKYIINGQELTIERERSIQDDQKIVHTVWAGDYELEKTDMACKSLPLIFVDQQSYINKEGKQVTSSFFKHAQDPQRLLNYSKSQSAYLMMTSRYDQFMGTAEHTASDQAQEIWSDPANHQGMLIYDKAKDGSVPIQLQPPQFPPQLMQEAESAMQFIQYTTGIFDTQLGNQGDVISGIASDHQSRKGARNTFVSRDNLNRAIAVTANIINEMIPIVYDTERTIRLNLPDKGMQNVTINQAQGEFEGSPVQNDMTQGDYNIKLIAGPSSEEENSDNIQSWTMLLGASPNSAPVMMDLVAKSLPLTDKIEIANRYRATIPPQILQAGKTGAPLPQQDPPPDPAVIAQQQQAQLAMQQIEMQKQKNQADYTIKMQQLALDEAELKLKAVTAHQDMSLEFEKIDTQRREAEAKIVEDNRRFEAEMRRIEADENISHHENISKIVMAGMPSNKSPTQNRENAYDQNRR
jgi:hypothetical protein